MSELNVVKRLKEIKQRMIELSKKQAVVGAIDNSVRKDGLTNAKLLSIHEFGAVINHPGGTGYGKNKKGKTRFLSSSFIGPVRIDGVTGPHQIVIPERPVMRTSAEKSREIVKKTLSRGVSECLRGNISVDKVYNDAGAVVRAVVQDTFNSNNFAVNKASTIRRKRGSTKPLIDTGALRASINFEVRNRE